MGRALPVPTGAYNSAAYRSEICWLGIQMAFTGLVVPLSSSTISLTQHHTYFCHNTTPIHKALTIVMAVLSSHFLPLSQGHPQGVCPTSEGPGLRAGGKGSEWLFMAP